MMSEMNDSENDYPQPIPCNECPAGMMHPRLITYFTWLGEELITVPHFPAWVCDMCGKREYDEKAISWLTMLLNPNAGKSTKKRRLPRYPRRRTDSIRPTPES
jgi:YgiT-type zinc finger domain-containing protein